MKQEPVLFIPCLELNLSLRLDDAYVLDFSA